jgi:hypothetical protein
MNKEARIPAAILATDAFETMQALLAGIDSITDEE